MRREPSPKVIAALEELALHTKGDGYDVIVFLVLTGDDDYVAGTISTLPPDQMKVVLEQQLERIAQGQVVSMGPRGYG